MAADPGKHSSIAPGHRNSCELACAAALTLGNCYGTTFCIDTPQGVWLDLPRTVFNTVWQLFLLSLNQTAGSRHLPLYYATCSSLLQYEERREITRLLH